MAHTAGSVRSDLGERGSPAAGGELVAKANAVTATVAAERAKVPLLGADDSVASELLGGNATPDGKTVKVAVDAVSVYLSLDGQKKCRGVYVVGPQKDARVIKGATWTGDRLLSQAVGHTVTVQRPPAATPNVSRWAEGAVPVLARWLGGELVELRIGDATP